MDEPMSRLSWLFQRYVNDACTEEERKELMDLMSRPEHAAALNQLIAGVMENTPANREIPADRAGELFTAIIKEAGERTPVRKLFPLRRVAAAAIILLLAGSAVFFFSKRSGEIKPMAVSRQPDIAPGHAGAILTLSNGRQIVLDSAGNGMLASDANVAIIKKDGVLTYAGKSNETIYNTIATPMGRQWQLTLGDGTKVWLNAGSSIRYPLAFSGHERAVEVTGETYFEVAPDAAAPFIVRTARQEIKVLGTRFNVNAYTDEPVVSTTLLDGAVSITSGNTSRIIKPGQQLSTQYATGEVAVSTVNTDNITAWTSGKFRFDNSDLKTVMRQLARWYDVEIEYRNAVPDLKFGGGTYRNINLSEVLEVLELNGVHCKQEGRKIIVMP